MKFGIFDHMDRGPLSLGEQFEARLKLIEAYDEAGFYAYHLAEHHSTPLGMTPSPSVFLAAIAQRTQRLRFGPLVYTLPLHHPLRLIEEVCMLDQMSGGRMELGIGRGISPYEVGYFGIDAKLSLAKYSETLDILLLGLRNSKLTYDGEFYKFHDVPIELAPVQRPHPPLWYGVAKAESTEWAARHQVNIVCGGPASDLRTLTDRYRDHWHAAGHSGPMALMGMRTFIVVADTDARAMQIARRAYAVWYGSFAKLWIEHGAKPIYADFPPDFEGVLESGQGVAGSPQTVCRTLAEQLQTGGVNYLVSRFAFGDLSLAESMLSLELFKNLVMPTLASIGGLT